MTIHPTSFEYEQLPSVMPLLDSVAFMWFVVIVTVAVFIWIALKLWHIHSLPKYLAKEKGMAQTRLIFWLCILGLAWKPLWVIAVLAIVTDWDKAQQWLRGTR